MAALTDRRTVDLDLASPPCASSTPRCTHAARPARRLRVVEPRGAHASPSGSTSRSTSTIDGHAGYYCAGMNQRPTVTVHGNAGVGVAENMMSGTVRVHGRRLAVRGRHRRTAGCW